MTTFVQPSRTGQRGSALIAVFWLIGILGMIMLVGIRLLDADTNVARTNRLRIYAQRFAETGLAIGRHPAITLDDPLLHDTADNGGGYDVTIRSEEARLNINTLLLQSDRKMLKRLFTTWEMKPDEADALVDALKDWVDADDLVSLNGAEKREYEKEGFDDMPFNRPFKDLDEMTFVRGMDRLGALRPDWRDFFTVHGDGHVDVNDARPEIIALLADVPLDRVQPLEEYRRGPDGVPDTMDDRRVSSVQQLAQLLGAYQPAVVQQLAQWVRFDGQIRRIESIGHLGGLSRKLVLITQGNQVLWRGEAPTS
jgi:type II secretory pathway component PulK